MICIRCGCEQQYNRRDRICDPCRKNMDELEAEQEKARAIVQSKLDLLRRFEDREEHVQSLIRAAERYEKAHDPRAPTYELCESAQWFRAAIGVVRSFVLQPNPALDPADKTGDKPGASSDDTSEVGENAPESHLSSVVEQRFRKPLETPIAEQASDEKPGKASDAADGGVGRAFEGVCMAISELPDRELSRRVIRAVSIVIGLEEEHEAEVRRLREQRDGFRKLLDSAHTTLARVEALPALMPQPFSGMIEEALRDPQPSAATPKDEMKLQRDENFAEIVRLRELNTLLSASLKKQDAELKALRDEHHDLLVRIARPENDIPFNGY